jgi:hypothetical protein
MLRPLSFALLICLSATAAHAQFLGTNFLTGDADGATANGASSAAAGTNATASGLASTALGQFAVASESQTTAVGAFAEASGSQTTAVGASAEASGTRATALGSFAEATGLQSTAIGQNAQASGTNSTALGTSANAGFANSVAIGVGVSTTRDDQFMFGDATNTYTAPGITSAASTSAQSGPVQVVTTDSSGNLAAADLGALGIGSAAQVERNTEGVAMAMALSGVDNILPNGTTYSLSANWGNFDNEDAVALGGAVRLYDNIFASGAGAVGTNSGHGGGRAGVTVAW